MIEIKPQPRQEEFLSSEADIVIFGGAAGGGKTWSLLYECLRHASVPRFTAVIFRHNANQIANAGGLWDASQELFRKYPGAIPRMSPHYSWQFADGEKLSFRHIERDEDVYKWQGAEITLRAFDELTHFTEKQFFYMLSRNRSTCGIRPYCRCTTNPDADSWVKDFISWWIDENTGYAIPERSGIIRYMARINEQLIWGNSVDEVLKKAEKENYDIDIKASDVKSVTFILSTLEDNQVLMQADPGYMANLKALSIVERERLLKGNWKIKAAAGLYFKRTQVGEMLETLPNDVKLWARGWDLAATSEDEKGDPAYTAGVLIGKRKNGRYVVADVINKRLSAAEVRKLIETTCKADKAKYGRVVERLPQDPGQAGKEQAQSYIKMLAGFLVKVMPESGSKESRAEPFAAQWQPGNVDILIADWNEAYFNQLESFPESKFKDMVDASSSAFNEIENGATYSAPPKNTTLSKSSYWR